MQQGLYEQLINKLISSKLNDLDRNTYFIKKTPIDKIEASKYLAQYLIEIIRFALNTITGDDSIEKQVELSNNIIKLVRDELSKEEFDEDLIEIGRAHV